MTKNANNKDAMRQENRRNVLSIVSRQQVSRADIAKETLLSQSTITSIVDELLAEKILLETGKDVSQSSMGRKPIMLGINPAWGYIIGIVIDREIIRIGILSIAGKVIGKTTQIGYAPTADATLDLIASEANYLMSVNGVNPKMVVGVGAIAPGPLDIINGRTLLIARFDESWHFYNLRDELEKRFPYKAFVQHNSVALMLRESRISENMQYNNMALYYLSTGIGFSLMINGQIYAGTKNQGCEIGHSSVEINGRLCDCGNRGCLELYAAITAIMKDVGYTRRDITSWEHLVDLAHENDRFCIETLRYMAQHLTQSILDMNNILNLDAVIFVGRVMYRGEMLLGFIKDGFQGKTVYEKNRSLVIKSSEIVKDIELAAAGAVVIDQLFNGTLYADIHTSQVNTAV